MPREGKADPTILRVESLKPRGTRVRVHLDEGEPLEVLLEALERLGLGAGDPLSSEQRSALKDADADLEVREAALSLLSHRARTRRELRKKLMSKRFPAHRVDVCLDRLEERGLLDDEAVAQAFVRDRLRLRPRGRARLVSELRAKGVKRPLAQKVVDEVLEEEEVDDGALALEVVDRWMARQSRDLVRALAGEGPDREKARRRLYGFLARRGFRGDALRRAMSRATDAAREL